jgi:hypothetical protein
VFNIEKFRRDVIDNRSHFVCTIDEFIARYGVTSKTTAAEKQEITSLAVLCKDGMIRPR